MVARHCDPGGGQLWRAGAGQGRDGNGPVSQVDRRRYGDYRERTEPAYRPRGEFQRARQHELLRHLARRFRQQVTWAWLRFGTGPLEAIEALMLDGFVGAEYRASLDRLKGRSSRNAARSRRPSARPRPAAPRPKLAAFRRASPGAVRRKAAVPQGAAVAPGEPASGAAAPAAGAAQTGSTSTPPAAAEVTPTPAPKPPKKKRRNQ